MVFDLQIERRLDGIHGLSGHRQPFFEGFKPRATLLLFQRFLWTHDLRISPASPVVAGNLG
jgi:hypothetical protein